MKRDANKDILLLSIFTFLTVALWIFFELTKTTKTSTITPQVQEVLTPLDPTIDTRVFEILSERQEY